MTADKDEAVNTKSANVLYKVVVHLDPASGLQSVSVSNVSESGVKYIFDVAQNKTDGFAKLTASDLINRKFITYIKATVMK